MAIRIPCISPSVVASGALAVEGGGIDGVAGATAGADVAATGLGAGIADGVAGMAFVEAAVRSSQEGGAWTDVPTPGI